jgi:hypothetical protein
MEDLSYLRTEYARNKDQESYDREWRQRRQCKTCVHRLNDHDEVPCDSCDDKSEWQQAPERDSTFRLRD